jgi:hypothetical protein
MNNTYLMMTPKLYEAMQRYQNLARSGKLQIVNSPAPRTWYDLSPAERRAAAEQRYRFGRSCEDR